MGHMVSENRSSRVVRFAAIEVKRHRAETLCSRVDHQEKSEAIFSPVSWRWKRDGIFFTEGKIGPKWKYLKCIKRWIRNFFLLPTLRDFFLILVTFVDDQVFHQKLVENYGATAATTTATTTTSTTTTNAGTDGCRSDDPCSFLDHREQIKGYIGRQTL